MAEGSKNPMKEEADRFGLEKCLRCLPHDMDTGEFFVALLKKVASMSAKAKKEALELAQEFQTNDTRDEEPESKCAKTATGESAHIRVH